MDAAISHFVFIFHLFGWLGFNSYLRKQNIKYSYFDYLALVTTQSAALSSDN